MYFSRRIAMFLLIASASPITAASGSQLWGTNSGSSSNFGLSPIDIATGAVAPMINIGAVGTASVDDMASDPMRQPGVVWGVRNPLAGNQLVSIDPFGQQLLATTSITAPEAIRSLAIDPLTGLFYGASTANLYRINDQTGATTLVGPTALAVDRALGFDSLGNLFGVANSNVLVSVNKQSGATSTIATMPLSRMEDMAFDPDSGIMYGLGFGYSLYQINLASGALNVVGPSLGRPAGMAFTIVPEPTTMLLCFSLLLTLATHSSRHSLNRRVCG